MKRADMLKKTIADAQQRGRHLEQRAAWYAAKNAEAAAEQADREAIAHMGAQEAFETLSARRQARGAPADRDSVFRRLPLYKQKILKLMEAR